MEVLRNPQLAKMSAEDLNQRYGESYVMYAGVPQYFHHFVTGDGGKMIVSHSNIATADQRDPEPQASLFQWDQLNTARPRAGWYMRQVKKDKQCAIHLSYPIRRQWKRGLTSRNTVLSFAGERLAHPGEAFLTLLQAGDLAPKRITDDILKTGRSVVLRADRLLFASPKEKACYDLFLRRERIAKILLEKNQLQFLRKGMEQELAEVSQSSIINSMQVEYVDPKKERPFFPEFEKDPELRDDADGPDNEAPDFLIGGIDRPPQPIWEVRGPNSRSAAQADWMLVLGDALVRKLQGLPVRAPGQVLGKIRWLIDLDDGEGIPKAGSLHWRFGRGNSATINEWSEQRDRRMRHIYDYNFAGFNFRCALFEYMGAPLNRHDGHDFYLIVEKVN